MSQVEGELLDHELPLEQVHGVLIRAVFNSVDWNSETVQGKSTLCYFLI
jgi:hypothetical protein